MPGAEENSAPGIFLSLSGGLRSRYHSTADVFCPVPPPAPGRIPPPGKGRKTVEPESGKHNRNTVDMSGRMVIEFVAVRLYIEVWSEEACLEIRRHGQFRLI